MNTTAYRIVGWDEHFENNRTRQMDVMRWVPIPNSFDGDRISELIADGQAPAYAAWVACTLVASKCHPRGTLLRSTKKPHNSVSLSRMTGLPAKCFETMFTKAVSVGLLEVINTDTTMGCQAPAETPPTPPAGACGKVTLQEGRKEGRKEGKEGIGEGKPRPPDPIWDTLAELFFPSGVCKSDQSRLGKVVRDLKTKSATPEEIQRRFKVAQKSWDDVTFGPEALCKNWDQLTGSTNSSNSPPRNIVRASDMDPVREELAREEAVDVELLAGVSDDEFAACLSEAIGDNRRLAHLQGANRTNRMARAEVCRHLSNTPTTTKRGTQ